MQLLETKSKDIVGRAVKAILQGKVLALPTDTVYGLLGDATKESVVRKIFKIKKRQEEKPLPIFVGSINTAKRLAVIDSRTEHFLKMVWPGKVTVVLQKKEDCPLPLVKKTVGLRLPHHPLLKKILEMVKRPLTATSANISGNRALVDGHQVVKEFSRRKNQPDFVLLGFCPKRTLPSTVIDLTGQRPKILRKGSCSSQKILKLIHLC